MTVHGDGSARRDFLHVDDHCRALDLLLHADRDAMVGQVLNLGTQSDISVVEIAHALQSIMPDAKAEIQFIGNRPGQVFRHTCNSSKAERLLSWKPAISFEVGLKRTVDWYVANRAWWEPQRWMRHIPIMTADGKKELH